MHQFMSDNNLDEGFSERVDSFFILLWGQTRLLVQSTSFSHCCRGEAFPGEERLLSALPQSLQEAVSMEECSSALLSHSMQCSFLSYSAEHNIVSR